MNIFFFIYSIIIPIINRFCSCIFMNKLKTPFLSILIGSFAGAIASFAFSSPGSNQPPNGNPIFWLLSGTSMYYTAGNVGIGTNSPSQKLEVTGTVYSSKAKSDTALGGEFLGSNGYWGLRTDTSNRFNLDVYNGGSSTSAITVTNSGSVGIGTTSPAASLDIAGTGSIKIPAGTTAQRPSSPASGMIRLNTTTGKIEYYNGSWIGIGSFSATGGTVADVGGYRIHTFTTSGTFTVTNGGNVEALVVGGGGGAGGLVYVSSLSVIPGSYTITVGAGGAGATSNGGSAPNGGDSIFSSITAKGGGGGGNYSGGSGATGGSGGGASGYSNPGNPGVGTSGQGNSGGYANGSATTAQTGGGGGGAGSVGSNSVQNNGGYTTGGSGLAYSISGSSVMYATGGNGGGDGWGGASSGAANTGNGGDGAGSPNSGSAGGSGIVIIRYPL